MDKISETEIDKLDGWLAVATHEGKRLSGYIGQARWRVELYGLVIHESGSLREAMAAYNEAA